MQLSQDSQPEPPIDPKDIECVITELGEIDRRIDIEVSERLVKRFFKKLKKSGQQLNDKQIQVLLSRICIEEAVRRLDSKPLFGPVPGTDEKPVLKIGQPYRMSILCDVAPELHFPDFKAITINRPVKKITEEMIEAELVQQCLDAGQRSEYSGPLEISDEYEGSFSLFDPSNDTQLLKVDSIHLRILAPGAPVQVCGLFFNELSGAMIGHAVGETVTCESTVPAGFPDQELVGSLVAFEVVINQAWRIDPAQVDEVLEQYGTPNEAVFRQQISLSLEQRAENDQHSAMSAQLFETILNDMEVPIPERILNHHQKLLHENHVRKLKETGLSSEEIDERLAPQEDRLRESALTMLSMSVITSQLCLQMGIQVDEQEVQDQIAIIASSQGRRPEEFRKELVDNDRVNSVFQEVLKIKLARKLFEEVKTIDMDADEWNRVRAGVGDSAG